MGWDGIASSLRIPPSDFLQVILDLATDHNKNKLENIQPSFCNYQDHLELCVQICECEKFK